MSDKQKVKLLVLGRFWIYLIHNSSILLPYHVRGGNVLIYGRGPGVTQALELDYLYVD